MTESELLFSEILNCDMLSLRLQGKRRLNHFESSSIASVLKRRLKGEPLQYILGDAEFMGLRFKVDSRVLIPRPETEILVEKAIELVASRKLQVASVNILEIGTGSGCIAVSLAKFLPGAKITATDISEEALELARNNAVINGVKIDFFRADLFSVDDQRPVAYDLIISNPPYIAQAQIAKLQPEIQYEPRVALNGGRDGLDFYRRLSMESPRYLKPKGLLVIEIGFGQADEVREIFRESAKLVEKEAARDYNNIERILVLEKDSDKCTRMHTDNRTALRGYPCKAV